MLVLTRAPDGKVIIGNQERLGWEVVVDVLEIKDGRVKLGVTAPKHIPVYRDELYEHSMEYHDKRMRRERRKQH